MAVTIKDVSAKCGLSISTVSKAFNNYADISLETRELVQRTAREIGYYPNATARTLKTNRSYNLGVLFQEKRGTGLTHSFFASVLDAFKSAGEKRGYDITFINHHIGWAGMTYLEHCRYRNVDGVCVVCADFYAPEVIELVDSNLPVVTIDHSFNNRSCVLSDNIGGLKLLVDAACQKGHRKIAYVHGEKSSVTENRIIGSGTILDTARLRARISEYFRISQSNVHAYVFGEHGDSSFIPWSVANISNVPINDCDKLINTPESITLPAFNRDDVEKYVRKSGGIVIERKGATFYAVSASVCHICKCILTGIDTTMTVSTMMHGEYGVDDVALSVLNIIGKDGVRSKVLMPLTEEETVKLRHSGDTLKEVINNLDI